MNLIISVIDSLMSAGSVYRRRKKKRKKKKRHLYFRIAAQENHPTQHFYKV